MAQAVLAFPQRRDTEILPDTSVIAACEAAKAAIRAFDEAARRGEGFATLCELSLREREALKAASAVRSASATGIAEKALLLDCLANEVRRPGALPDCATIALSLAADAIALAKTIGAAPP